MGKSKDLEFKVFKETTNPIALKNFKRSLAGSKHLPNSAKRRQQINLLSWKR